VIEAFVSSSRWTESFNALFAEQGYRMPLSLLPTNGPPTFSLPWANLDQISLHFNGNVQVDADDLHVFGVNVREYQVTSVRFDPDLGGFSGTATWTLSRPLVNDKVLLVADGSESGPRATWGGLLDGDYDNRAGGDFRYRLDVLPGDGDRSGRVSAIDLSAVRTELGTSTSNPGTGAHSYVAFDDLNGDGRINALDLAGIKQRLNTQLPQAEPAAPASSVLTASSPTGDLFGSQPILPG